MRTINGLFIGVTSVRTEFITRGIIRKRALNTSTPAYVDHCDVQ